MTTKLPTTVGQYRIVKSRIVSCNDTEGVTRSPIRTPVSRTHLNERLAVLIASGKVAASTVVSKYQDFVAKFSGE